MSPHTLAFVGWLAADFGFDLEHLPNAFDCLVRDRAGQLVLALMDVPHLRREWFHNALLLPVTIARAALFKRCFAASVDPRAPIDAY